MGKWTRRAFIATGSLLGGGLVLGVVGVAVAPNRLRIVPESEQGSQQITTWIKITPDNWVSVIVPHCEMGQGAQTALAMMLAEELDADWEHVRVEEAPAESAFANGYIARAFLPATIPAALDRAFDYATYKAASIVGSQVTGGSSSLRGTGQYGMRMAGAAARTMLLQTAAARWQVPITECVAKLSLITHTRSGRKATYGELAGEAAQLKPPRHPQLKERYAYSIVGSPRKRFDIPAKVNGTAKYAIDIALPGMLYAAVSAARVFGGRLESVDTSVATSMPGVRVVLKLDDAVAVVADGYWRAQKALRALKPVFTDEGNGAVSTAAIFTEHDAALEREQGDKQLSAGLGAEALSSASRVLEATYRVPFLAHATLEPMCATARIMNERCEVWAGTQDPLWARRVAAKAIGFDPEQVVLHNQISGGGFGRRLPGAFDYIEQTVRIAQAVAPAPVKMIWSREEDTRHDFYRRAVTAQFRGGIDDEGKPTVWTARYNGSGEGHAAAPPYDIANQEIRAVDVPTHVRLGSWRSVEHSQHGFFVETFIDELAHAAGQDPLQFRRALLAKRPRHLSVLSRVALMSGWGSPIPAGRGRGVAVVESFGTVVAEVAEVEVSSSGELKVLRVFAAVDCGYTVNPDSAAAQIEGGILFGLSAALFEEITVEKGCVVESSFPDYPVARLASAPAITVEFVMSDAPLGGLGEPGVPPIAPAIANAVFAATGKRIREVPLRKHKLQVQVSADADRR